MKRFFGKFAFIHRRLWQRDGAYRLAFLAGPAPLLGAALAAAIWGGTIAVKQLTYTPPPWGTQAASNLWNTSDAEPQALKPARSLPQIGADGVRPGYHSGWNAVARLIEVRPTFEIIFKPNSVANFTINGPVITMMDILAAAPLAAPYVAIGSGFFVANEPGVYAVAARFDRQPGLASDCLIDLGLGPHMISTSLEINGTGSVSKNYAAASFDLQPGLFPATWVFSCWHDQQPSDLGRMTILVRHPGETSLQPAHVTDFIHP